MLRNASQVDSYIPALLGDSMKAKNIKVALIGLAIIICLLLLSNWTWSHLESKDLHFIMRVVSSLIIGVGVGIAIVPFFDL